MSLNHALEGLKVLDFSQIGAGPTIGMLLGDMGAEVVKVEAPSGDLGRLIGPPWLEGDSVVALSFNRNKKGLCLDLKKPEAVATVHRLAASVDVVIESFRPGVMTRLGVGWETLSALNPRLIWCAVTAYGQDGPWADRPGVDGVVQALSGLMSQIGVDGAEPCKVQVPAVDMTTGFLGTVAVLGALQERSRSGRGQYLDISMYNAALMLQQTGIASYLASGELPRRIGSAAPYAAPNEAYRTADGWIMLAAYQPPRWKALCDLLELGQEIETDPRFADNDARVRNRAALRVLIEARLSQRTTAEWQPLLESRDIMCAPVADYAWVTGSDQFEHVGAAVSMDLPSGAQFRVPGFLLGDRHAQARVRHAPPSVGQHSREILEGFGLTPHEVGQLIDSGAVINHPAHDRAAKGA
jgi:crotonobetainyl-CoA:carnitine CoA-transferase CaiB-like acyl-CoA transferase